MLAEEECVKLQGVDVGFSTSRATTAIALLDGDRLHLARVGTTWGSRAAQIPSDFRASVIAIDGPLLPQESKRSVGSHLNFQDLNFEI
jgi:hypothetical protein